MSITCSVRNDFAEEALAPSLDSSEAMPCSFLMESCSFCGGICKGDETISLLTRRKLPTNRSMASSLPQCSLLSQWLLGERAPSQLKSQALCNKHNKRDSETCLSNSWGSLMVGALPRSNCAWRRPWIHHRESVVKTSFLVRWHEHLHPANASFNELHPGDERAEGCGHAAQLLELYISATAIVG